MQKIKQKKRDEIEELKGQIRNLRKQVQHLKKELARKTKREHQYHDLEERERTVEIDVEFELEPAQFTKGMCPECNSAVDKAEIGNRILTRCTKCKWRKSEKGN